MGHLTTPLLFTIPPGWVLIGTIWGVFRIGESPLTGHLRSGSIGGVVTRMIGIAVSGASIPKEGGREHMPLYIFVL